MALTTAPFVMRDVTLSLKPVASGTAEEYRCQLNKAQITPAGGGGASITYDTFCATFSEQSGGATFTLDLGGFQAYADVADLSILLWNSAGEKYTFVLTPLGGTISATNPGFTGEVTLIEAVVGGTANQYATFEVSLPCSAKPTAIVAPPVMADEESRAEAAENEPVAA